MSENNIWVRGYTSDGFQISLTLAISSVQDALKILDDIRAAGIKPAQPEAALGETETIAAVIRRTASDGTPIIDFYPEWSHNGEYGQLKWAHLYLNTPEDVAQFEAQSGLKLTELPEYAGDAPVKRKAGQMHGCERRVKRGFQMMKTPDGQHDNGYPKYKYGYALPIAIQPHWATNGGGERVANKMRELGIKWEVVKSQIEPGKVLEKMSDTALTEVQVMEWLVNFHHQPRK